ncbi:MAG: hypothetical protein J0M25_07435 [Flavobacteriales bacterium]|nr:hypothetical protein [Flavobacteriales bacterium]
MNAIKYFNSNMVRLKEENGDESYFDQGNFNSNMVRLKDNTTKTFSHENGYISIPIWLD